MSSSEQKSINFHTNVCCSDGCDQKGDYSCRHCSKFYCYLCFMCHRKYLAEQMRMLSEQMTLNRQQSVKEVVEFIDRQALDAQKQADDLVNEAVDRIRKLGENIHKYIDARRSVKVRRVDECLEKLKHDEEILDSNLQGNICLPASELISLRRHYASNMFDSILPSIEEPTPKTNENFFENYRLYTEMMQLRQSWPFLEAAMTSVYFTSRKPISLDEVLTFSEFRHDRVMENYFDEKSKEKENEAFDEAKNSRNFGDSSQKKHKAQRKRRRRNRYPKF